MAESSVVDPVEIQFDQPRRLYFNLKALRALDRVMGEIGIQKSLELIHALNFTTLERAMWAGLLHEEPNLTVNIVSKRLEKFVDSGGDVGDLFAAAYRAINESRVFGKPSKPEDEPGNVRPEPVA
jgi:hypothetical protein